MKRYRVIYADPPYRFGSRGIRAGRFQKLETVYKTMAIPEILALPIRELVANNAALFLWTPSAFLILAAGIFQAWGFEYKRIDAVWLKKTRLGGRAATVGPWGMGDVEILLMGTRGRMLQYQKVNNLFQGIDAIRTSHSRKPDIFRKRIEDRFGLCRRLELFARERFPGWDAFGNEVKGSIIL